MTRAGFRPARALRSADYGRGISGAGVGAGELGALGMLCCIPGIEPWLWPGGCIIAMLRQHEHPPAAWPCWPGWAGVAWAVVVLDRPHIMPPLAPAPWPIIPHPWARPGDAETLMFVVNGVGRGCAIPLSGTGWGRLERVRGAGGRAVKTTVERL